MVIDGDFRRPGLPNVSPLVIAGVPEGPGPRLAKVQARELSGASMSTSSLLR